MRNLTLILTIIFSCCLIHSVSAQTVVNKYAAVLDFRPCGNRIEVDDATDFNVGDTILVIQMKGAGVDSSNSAAFGDVINYNGAGHYEFNTIKAKTLNELTLTYQLQRSYEFIRGRVQIVRVPYFQNYTISVPHTCLPWNGTKGGVLAINVANTLTVNDVIDVSGKGFAGGAITGGNIFTCDYLDFAYPIGADFGGNKGEGIAEVGPLIRTARGKLSNGGGGGNNTNAGGGGGGNAGFGGQGGRQWELCDVFLNTGGIGGLALPYTTVENRIFLGGGGGAGHENNNDTDPGGNGGGIIIINAGTYDGLDTIKANGDHCVDVNSQLPGPGDGQSGGGAGGVIFLKVNSFTNFPILQAKGGNGGNIYTQELFGPGGGGSGGAVLFNASPVPLANIDIAGGVNGTNIQTANTHFALSGEPGLVINNFPYLLPIDTFKGFAYSVTDSFIDCNTIVFTALANGGQQAQQFIWDFGDGSTGTGNPITHQYTAFGTYTVQLIIPDTLCPDTVLYSVFVDIVTAGFTVSDDTICQGGTVTFTNTSSPNAVMTAWNFADGTVDSSASPTHAFPNAGNYNVSLIVSNNALCFDTMYRIIVVDSISPLEITTPLSVLCEGEGIEFEALYIKDASRTLLWDFGDGFSSESNPIVHAFDTSGTYPVKVTVTFRRCPDVSMTKDITISPYPTLNLGQDTSICPNSEAVTLSDKINNSNPDARWTWNNGETSSSILVRHPGVYTAYVDVNGCVTNDSVEVFKDCYIDVPNAFTPNNDGSNDYFLPRQLMSKGVRTFKMTIYNRWGQIIFETNSINGRGWDGKFNDKEQPAGVYIYSINATLQNGGVEKYTGNLTLLR
jgi:gliding motility-associated-like protein